MYAHIVAQIYMWAIKGIKGGSAGCVFTTLRVTLTFHWISSLRWF